MQRALSAVLGLLCAYGCGEDVPVGGHEEDLGSQDGGAQGEPMTAADYARDDIACASDADCCVVIDGCHAVGLVVSASDQRMVRQLLDTEPVEETECLRCIQVSCENAVCVGTSIEGTDFLDTLAVDHCGTVGESDEGETGSMHGCIQ
jgi:hypothetical protein